MPLIQNWDNLPKSKISEPKNKLFIRDKSRPINYAPTSIRPETSTIDREQLEYSARTLFTYGVILFTALGIGASVTYMTVQQLRK